MYRRLGDYQAMQGIVDHQPGEFSTPGLRGWRLAAAGFLTPHQSAELFAQAADSFAADAPPTADVLLTHGGSWSGENKSLWANYFAARAALACIPRDPHAASALILKAQAHLKSTASGFVNPQVSRLRILVRALVPLIAGGDAAAIGEAMSELHLEQSLSGEHDTDEATQRFLAAADVAVSEFRREPTTALTSGRLAVALDMLGQLPLIGVEVAEAVQPAIGRQILEVLHGPTRTWVHRTLESVDDERILQRIFYRLSQSRLPRYAQIRHGPLEYGKDVVVLSAEGASNVLRMYQMKCGDLTMSAFRDVRSQLEELFLVPLASVNVTARVDERVGVLVCNGHAQPSVGPVMLGWFDEQLRDHGRRCEFIHLDDLANWIISDRLVSEFRSALAEVGLSTR